MIKLSQAVIVEGKYDKIRLSGIIDATIVTTEGFRIFSDRERVEYIRRLAEKRGIIILTDSDSAGFLIRKRLTGAIPGEQIINAYIPDISGKEKRKNAPSKEGLLGVEGMDARCVLKALEKAGVEPVGADGYTGTVPGGAGCDTEADVPAHSSPGIGEADSPPAPITKADMFAAGLTGSANAGRRRELLKKSLSLPSRLSANGLFQALNALYSREEFFKAVSAIPDISPDTAE